MRRFLVWSGTLVGILGTVISLLLIVTRTLPFSIPVQQLYLIACKLPCLAGITINQTHVDAAKQRLNETFGSIGYVEDTYITGDDGFYFLSWGKQNGGSPRAFSRIQVTFNDGVATSISLGTYTVTDESMPNLAEALLIFGVPTCLWTAAENDPHVRLVYENQSGPGEMMIAVDTGLSMISPIQYIWLDSQRTGECERFGSEWRGFMLP